MQIKPPRPERREKNRFIGLPPCFTVMKRKAKMGTSLDQWKFISHAKWPSIVAAISLLTDHEPLAALATRFRKQVKQFGSSFSANCSTDDRQLFKRFQSIAAE
jgi:hypothetical protein